MTLGKREIWLPVKSFLGYFVSSAGRVQSTADGKLRNSPNRILKPGNNGNGYLFVNLRRDKKTFHILVHRLVAEAFLPPRGKTGRRLNISHVNGDKADNRASNLKYLTHSETMIQARNRGGLFHKLTEQDKKVIAHMYLKGSSCDEIAKLFSVSETTIRYWLVRREDGKHLTNGPLLARRGLALGAQRRNTKRRTEESAAQRKKGLERAKRARERAVALEEKYVSSGLAHRDKLTALYLGLTQHEARKRREAWEKEQKRAIRAKAREEAKEKEARREKRIAAKIRKLARSRVEAEEGLTGEEWRRESEVRSARTTTQDCPRCSYRGFLDDDGCCKRCRYDWDEDLTGKAQILGTMRLPK